MIWWGSVSGALLFLYILLHLTSVQSFLGRQVANYLSNQWKCNLSLESLSIDWFDQIELKGFLLLDQQEDTLLYVNELDIELHYFNRSFTAIEITKLELNQPYLNLYSLDTSSFNSSFIINALSSDEESEAINLSLDYISIHQGRFRYHDYKAVDSGYGINYDHLDLSQVNLAANGLTWKDSTLKLAIENLACYESNGFDLKGLTSNFTYTHGLLNFEHLIIRTEQTELFADYTMHYQKASDFSDFNQKVRLDADFREAVISLKDLSFFVPQLYGIDDQLYLSGKVRGTVDNLKGRKIALVFNQETHLFGSFDIRGLPEFENTYLHFDLSELKTTADGLRDLPYPPFSENNHLFVPKNMNALGDIRFEGQFTGFYNDFVAYGNFDTKLGSVQTDLSLKESSSGDFEYKGEVNSKRFLIGSLINYPDLSEMAVDLQLSGQGVDVKRIRASANGEIPYFVWKDYRYDKMELNGDITNETFTGDVKLHDENLDFDFSGLIDGSSTKLVSRFKFDLRKANLAKLNLFNQKDTSTTLSFQANFDLLGKEIDDLEGIALISDIHYADTTYQHDVNKISLSARNNSSSRSLVLSSDILDASIEGQFKIASLNESLEDYFQGFLKEASKSKTKAINQEFKFDIVAKKPEVITHLFYPELSIDSSSNLYGRINTAKRMGEFRLELPGAEFRNMKLTDMHFALHSNNDSLEIEALVPSFHYESQEFRKIELQSSLRQSTANTRVFWDTVNNANRPGNIFIKSNFKSLYEADFRFTSSNFQVGDSVWVFSDSAAVYVDSNSIHFKDFRLSNANQFVDLNGGISKSPNDTFNIILQHIDLSYVTAILPEGTIDLKGIANGAASFKNDEGDLSILSDIKMNQLAVNGTDIGAANLISTWNPKKEALKVNANLGEGKENILKVKGNVYPLKSENSLDLVLSLEEAPIGLLEPYLQDYLSDIQGTLSGSISIEGEAAKPLLNGAVNLQGASFTIDYLNTTYSIDDRIFIRPDYIGFDLIEIKDEQGSIGIATGTIFHNNYQDFNLDIGLQVQDFLALNTNSTQNDLYYGRAVVSGNANISGYANQTILEIKVKTEKGTDFNIPLSDGVSISDNDFLVFSNAKKEVVAEEEIDLSGIQMNFDLDIQPEARVQIIFDEQVGDIIKGNGEGNLKLEINTLGDFNIYGQYVVQQGDYLFTLQNVINKKFEIASGSRISWDGDPYEATIDIKAIYSLRASLYDLMPEDTTSNLRRRVPVDLELQMTNKLLAPDIGFDIRLPSSGDNIQRRLESILYLNSNDVNRQEMNQQVFGLLVLNRFLPPTSGVANDTKYDRGTPGINNGYEFISNQLSNWLSQVSDQFDIGVNYRPGDEITNDELDLSLSTEVFNERLVLDGNLGYSSTNNTEQVAQQNNSAFIGEFSAEYKLSQDGRFRVRGFNRSTNNNLLQNTSPYTQGVGLFYREEFDTIGELWRRYFGSGKDDAAKAN